MKGLSKEEQEARSDLVDTLKQRIEAIPDGSTHAAKQGGDHLGPWASQMGIKFDSNYGNQAILIL